MLPEREDSEKFLLEEPQKDHHTKTPVTWAEGDSLGWVGPGREERPNLPLTDSKYDPDC